MPSNYRIGSIDLDDVFRLRATTKRGDVSYAASSTDISNRYEKSQGTIDQINYDTNIKYNGQDLRYLFKNKNYIDPPTYSITTTSTSVNEGGTVTFNVTTTNFGSGTLFWTVSRPADFASGSGSVAIVNNSGSFTVTVLNDFTSEGAESFTASLRTGSVGGTIVDTSNSVIINDTSVENYYMSGTIYTYSETYSKYWNRADGKIAVYTAEAGLKKVNGIYSVTFKLNDGAIRTVTSATAPTYTYTGLEGAATGWNYGITATDNYSGKSSYKVVPVYYNSAGAKGPWYL